MMTDKTHWLISYNYRELTYNSRHASMYATGKMSSIYGKWETRNELTIHDPETWLTKAVERIRESRKFAAASGDETFSFDVVLLGAIPMTNNMTINTEYIRRVIHE